MEIIPDRNSEERIRGEIVVTCLHSYAMPFIRYRLGDCVELGPTPCPCGAPYATISKIRGRLTDRIFDRDGAELHPSAVDQTLRRHAPWVKRYQVVQEDLERILIRVEGTAGPGESDRLANELKAASGLSFRFEVVACRELKTSKAGKFRLYESKLTKRHDYHD